MPKTCHFGQSGEILPNLVTLSTSHEWRNLLADKRSDFLAFCKAIILSNNELIEGLISSKSYYTVYNLLYNGYYLLGKKLHTLLMFISNSIIFHVKSTYAEPSSFWKVTLLFLSTSGDHSNIDYNVWGANF